MEIANGVAYRYLSAQAARNNHKVPPSGNPKDWLPNSNNSWWEAGAVDLMRKGRSRSEF